MNVRFCIVLVALMATGCAHTVQYKLDPVDRFAGPQIEKTVTVKTFGDETVPPPAGVTRIGDYDWRNNVRSGYKDKEIAVGVSSTIAKHLAYSGLFKKVSYEAAEDQADLLLTGTIAEYSVQARVNKGAETTQAVSAGFGLIGALVGAGATAGQKTEIITHVQLRNVELQDRASGKLLWQDTIEATNDLFTDFGEANQAVLYRDADNSLKDAISEMIRRISLAVAAGFADTNKVEAAPQPVP